MERLFLTNNFIVKADTSFVLYCGLFEVFECDTGGFVCVCVEIIKALNAYYHNVDRRNWFLQFFFIFHF